MELPERLRGALRWPSFVIGVLLMYWAVVLATLTGGINLLRRRKRNDIYCLSTFLVSAFRVRVLHVGQQELYRGRCMHLANHRSWADFFIDVFLTEGRSIPLSRGMVAVGFPALLTPLMPVGAILVFNKGKGTKGPNGIELFNRWLDRRLRESPHSGMLVYPEGHRATNAQSQPLRRGMLHYAYFRRLPMQMVVSANKEAVLAEKEDMARFGQTVVTGYSELVEPARFDSAQAFMEEVQRQWDALWKQVYAAPLTGLPELPPPQDDSLWVEYTPAQQALSAAIILGWTSALSAWVWLAYKAAGWAGRLLGPAFAPLAVALLVVYCAASLWECSRPVDARGAGAGKQGAAAVGMEGDEKGKGKGKAEAAAAPEARLGAAVAEGAAGKAEEVAAAGVGVKPREAQPVRDSAAEEYLPPAQ